MKKKEYILIKVIQQYGSQAKLAKLLGVTQQIISVWMRRHRVPAEKVLLLEKLSSGQVTRFQLRPDIYPKEK